MALTELITNPRWFSLFILSIIWSIYILVFKGKGMIKDNDKKTLERHIEATKKAIVALIIAIFAYIDITIAVYWVVWIMAFYLSGWT